MSFPKLFIPANDQPSEPANLVVQHDPTSHGGSNGGTPPNMERVAKLEALMEVVRADIGSLKTDLRDVRERSIKLEERISHLPSKEFVVKAALGTVGAITAIMTFVTVFQSKIQHIIGVN